MTAPHAEADHGHGPSHPPVNYFFVFTALCVCTVLSYLLDEGKSVLGRTLMITGVMTIAVCKATFVMMYFMHLRFEAAWKYILLAPTAVLAMALPFTLAPDIAFHYYVVQVPQRYTQPHGQEVGAQGAHGSAHGGAAHAEPAAHGAEHGPKGHAEPKPAADHGQHKPAAKH